MTWVIKQNHLNILLFLIYKDKLTQIITETFKINFQKLKIISKKMLTQLNKSKFFKNFKKYALQFIGMR